MRHAIVGKLKNWVCIDCLQYQKLQQVFACLHACMPCYAKIYVYYQLLQKHFNERANMLLLFSIYWNGIVIGCHKSLNVNMVLLELNGWKIVIVVDLIVNVCASLFLM